MAQAPQRRDRVARLRQPVGREVVRALDRLDDVRVAPAAGRRGVPRRADHRLRPRRAPQSWQLIRDLRALGTTILLTTHCMEEAQQLADRVVVISGGRLIADGAPDTLGHDHSAIVTFRLPPGLDVPELPAGSQRRGREVTLRTTTPTRDRPSPAIQARGPAQPVIPYRAMPGWAP